ncbi:glycoside hydrolase family protein [Catellatospora sp. KI3]|uniref:glycoside hydrolase family protein n=1 Tax=Catellatospora sp. KI3 TaxID=3041620 RepID=UPI002482BC50|nr:glycoside hydrolase family protein [Catellatospora sp. KI3]MDI1464697.1 glycoside hydrolase family protein [Catellatospora sp. KI3]
MEQTPPPRPGRHARRSPLRRWWPALLPLLLVVLVAAVWTLTRPGPSPDRLADAAGPPAQSTGAAATRSPSPLPSPPVAASPSRSPRPSPSGSAAGGGAGRRSAKKGVSVWEFAGLGAALKDVGASWYYNWASGPTGGAGGSAAFVPMIWGANSVNDGELARAKANGRELLGFNEPDFASQSNMTVERALELWPRLQATGLRLGSPAVAVGADRPGGWLDRFLSGARDRGYRVDFIALHWYGSDFSPAAVDHLRDYVQAVWNRYHKPIWLTEYALIKWGPGGAVFPTDAQQASFATRSTAMLQSLSSVERYAWFALPTPKEGNQGTGLYRPGALATAAGRAYRAAG